MKRSFLIILMLSLLLFTACNKKDVQKTDVSLNGNVTTQEENIETSNETNEETKPSKKEKKANKKDENLDDEKKNDDDIMKTTIESDIKSDIKSDIEYTLDNEQIDKMPTNNNITSDREPAPITENKPINRDVVFVEENFNKNQPDIDVNDEATIPHTIPTESHTNHIATEKELKAERTHNYTVISIRDIVNQQKEQPLVKLEPAIAVDEDVECNAITQENSQPQDYTKISVDSILLSTDQTELNLDVGQISSILQCLTKNLENDEIIEYFIDDSNIVEISKYGIIRAKKPGETTITIKYRDKEIQIFCIVK